MREDEVKFNAAIALRDAKRYREALDAFVELIGFKGAQRRLVVHSHLQAGQLARKLLNYPIAEHHARTAVELAPKNELASMLLYQVLFATARLMDALREMVRFVEHNDSKLYRLLLVRGYDLSEFGSEYVALVDQAREQLAQRSEDGDV